VQVKLGTKQLKPAPDEVRGTVGMAAGAAAVDLAQPAAQQLQTGRAAGGRAAEFAGYGVQSEDARPALAG
jgi:hypothetical protein